MILEGVLKNNCLNHEAIWVKVDVRKRYGFGCPEMTDSQDYPAMGSVWRGLI